MKKTFSSYSTMWLQFLIIIISFFSTSFFRSGHIKNIHEFSNDKKPIVPGANQVEKYMPYLKGKRVGMLVNQTSIIGHTSLLDSLRAIGVDIKTIFGPEHGFRANASNGAEVADEIDARTGIPVISLYGQKRKPSKKDMDAIDVMIFDIQDVGCRFYTNINTLYDVMEACAEFGKELIILDRPNPNGLWMGLYKI